MGTVSPESRGTVLLGDDGWVDVFLEIVGVLRWDSLQCVLEQRDRVLFMGIREKALAVLVRVFEGVLEAEHQGMWFLALLLAGLMVFDKTVIVGSGSRRRLVQRILHEQRARVVLWRGKLIVRFWQAGPHWHGRGELGDVLRRN